MKNPFSIGDRVILIVSSYFGGFKYNNVYIVTALTDNMIILDHNDKGGLFYTRFDLAPLEWQTWTSEEIYTYNNILDI